MYPRNGCRHTKEQWKCIMSHTLDVRPSHRAFGPDQAWYNTYIAILPKWSSSSLLLFLILILKTDRIFPSSIMCHDALDGICRTFVPPM